MHVHTNRPTNPVNILERASFWLSLIALFALGVLVIPITSDFLSLSKLYLAFSLSGFFLLIYGLLVLFKKRVELVTSDLTWPLLFFGVVVVTSTFLTNNYPIKGLLDFGGVLLSFVLVALLGGSILPKKIKQTTIAWALVILSFTLIILGFLSLLGFGPEVLLNRWFGLNLPTRSLAFNLSGSALIAAQVIVMGLVVVAIRLKRVLIARKKVQTLISTILLSLLALGLSLYVWALLPGKDSSLRLQSPIAGWSVALDTIRVPKHALIGAGPASYALVYQKYKPLWVNGQHDWDVTYLQASLPPLTILTTLGFAGLIAWILLIFRGVALARLQRTQAQASSNMLLWLILVAFLMQLLLPFNVVILMMTALLIAFYTASQRSDTNTLVVEPLIIFSRDQKYLDKRRWPQILIGSGLILVSLTSFYLLGRSYLGFYHFDQAARAMAQNDGVKAYQELVTAIKLNPYLDSFRRQLALLDINLATVLANKADLTDKDKQQVAQLFQEATQEAKAATILDPADWRNWYVLAQVYNNMIGIAKDADQWAIQAYIKAIENNPTDPGLRIALGGIFLNQKDYQQAASIFRQAVNVKPDYPNSYYNLAVALKSAKQYEQSKQAYETLLKLLKPDSDDYIKASKELKELKEMMKQSQDQSSNGTQESSETTAPSIIDQKLNSIQSGQVDQLPENTKNTENAQSVISSPTPTP